MRTPTLTLMTVALSATLAGCATLSMQQQVSQQEHMLSAAGFNTRLADTPRKMSQLQQLPPYKIIVRNRNGQPFYAYADPQYCQCLLVGNERAYQNYRRLAVEQNIANEQYIAAQMNEETAMDWSVWGPVW